MKGRLKKTIATALTFSTVVVMNSASPAFADTASTSNSTGTQVVSGAKANTPIQHVVVLFDENESFDHYFGTYPIAKNPSNEPPFYAAPGTPSINGLLNQGLLNQNPNQANPQRLDRSQAMTPDMDHGYDSEKKSFDNGLMDKFVENNGHGKSIVMDYYDGNTVTAFWNYAQHFAMSDNSFGSDLGPSTPGAINVISGNDSGATAYDNNAANGGKVLKPGDKGFPTNSVSPTGTLYGDTDPYFDYASKGDTASLKGTNVGDLLNAKGLTWGSFFGGYDDPTATHKNVGGQDVTDYIPHHEPFQYYNDTSGTYHKKPSSPAMIGHTDQAQHQYDLTDFWTAANAGNLPNYSFLKAPAYEDGHPSYSDPLDEQQWLTETVNRLEKLPTWKNTAIIIAYDDSDGWYDHVMPPIVNQSSDEEKRLGYGPRLPLVIVSPYAKHNYVSNTVTDQTSVLRFVEDNWNLGRIGNGSFDTKAGSLNDMFDFSQGYNNPSLFLDRYTGEPSTQIIPFQEQGHLYMSIKDLEQSLDVQPYAYEDGQCFMYGSQFVEISKDGDTVKVDGNTIDLGAPVVNNNGSVCIPIENLAKAINVTPVEYDINQVLFKSNDVTNDVIDTTENSISDSSTNGGILTGKSGVKFTIEDDNAADALKITSPISMVSPTSAGKIINQNISGVNGQKTYNFVIKATDANGNPAYAGSNIYVKFENGGMNEKGKLTAGGKDISTQNVPVTLDSEGKATLTYTVDVAPTDWDAYENDVITISDLQNTSASSSTNQVTILN